MVERVGFECVPLQDPKAIAALGLTPGILPGEIKLLTSDQRVLGGVDAFGYVARYVWWAFPFHLLMQIPLTRALAGWLYLPIARYRQKISSTCGLRPMMQTT